MATLLRAGGLLLLLCLASVLGAARAKTHNHEWDISSRFAYPGCIRELAVAINTPTVRVVQGDTVVVTVNNSLLTESVLVRWHGHGIRQINRTPPCDNRIVPGESCTYSFVLDRPGQHMYHARSAGLDGTIVVDVLPVEAESATYGQAAALDNAPNPIVWIGEPQFISILINGCPRLVHPECWMPVFTVVPAKTSRFRFASVTSLLDTLTFKFQVANFLGLVSLGAFFIWLWRNHDEFPDRADHDQLWEIPEEQPHPTTITLDAKAEQVVEATATIRPDQLEIPEDQPRQTTIKLDAEQVGAAIDAMLGSFEQNIRRISLPREPPQAASSDSDGSSSSSSDDERNHRDEHLLHPLVASLGAYMEMLDGLPNADAVETVPRILRDSQEPDGLCRLPDVARNRWILHAGTETITNACDLTAQSTGMIWLKKSKITAKILCSIWTELDELNWQEQQKKEWFVEVAGQSVEKILEVARSFSDARWSDGHILDLLTTFDAC